MGDHMSTYIDGQTLDKQSLSDDCESSGECTGNNQVCTVDNKCACSPHYKDNGEGVCKTLKGAACANETCTGAGQECKAEICDCAAHHKANDHHVCETLKGATCGDILKCTG